MYMENGKNINMGSPYKLFQGNCVGMHSCFTGVINKCGIPLRSPYIAIIGPSY